MASTEPFPRFLRQHVLGSEAVYAVVGEAGDVVTAEVVRAPGLAPGTRLRLTAEAAGAMERFDPYQRRGGGRRRRHPFAAVVPRLALAR